MRVLVLVFLAFIFLSSCKTDEDPTPWVGTWLYRGTIIKKASSPGFTSAKEDTDCERKNKVVFTDKTYISHSHEEQIDKTCLETVVEVPYTVTVTQEKYRTSTGKLNFSLAGKAYEFDIQANMMYLTITHRSGDSIVSQNYKKQ